MCLTLFAALAAVTQIPIEIDEITMGGSMIDRTGTPSHECSAVGMSADGQTVVGYGTPIPESRLCGFVWNPVRGVQALEWPREVAEVFSFCMASGISDDGKVTGGTALWLQPDSKVARFFKRPAVPTTFLGKFPISDASIGPINRDGSVLVVEVAGRNGSKLFLWSPQTGLKPIQANGKRLIGSVQDISSKGDVLTGSIFRNSNFVGFVVSKGKYYEIKPPAGFSSSKAERLTADGKFVFGNFEGVGKKTRGYRWQIGKGRPQSLPFVVESVSDKGEVIAGWADNVPALLVGGRVISMAAIVGNRMTPEETAKLRLVSVRQTKTHLYILADANNPTTDYRISIPLPVIRDLQPCE